MPERSASEPAWAALLDAPVACDHLVQLYTDDDFLARAVARFVGAGFASGEAAVIIATPEHVALFLDRVPGAVQALAGGQLVVLDARDTLDRFMLDGRPDRAAFLAVVGEVLGRVRAAGYPTIRLYGEMVNLLWEANALEPAVELEELWNELLKAEGLPLLCAYRLDNFDRHAHHHAVASISRVHSHLIPVDDYARFERAVDRAYTDVFGEEGDPRLLRELLAATLGPTSSMPRAQAALLALRSVHPQTADAVLERARQHYARD